PAPVNIPIQTPEPEDVAPPAPCPPDDAGPVPLGEIAANVLNGTSVSGLAAGTATQLAERGIVIGDEANAPTRFEGVVRIVTGPTAVAEAHTVAAHFPQANIELDNRTEETLTITVGEAFEELVPEDQVNLDPEVPLDPLPGCEPVPAVDSDEDDDDGDGDGGDGDGDDE